MERMFANAFRYFRNKAGLTQAVVARKAGLDQSEISKLEDGFHWAMQSALRKKFFLIIWRTIFLIYRLRHGQKIDARKITRWIMTEEVVQWKIKEMSSNA